MAYPNRDNFVMKLSVSGGGGERRRGRFDHFRANIKRLYACFVFFGEPQHAYP